ncbi:hypothetical protein COV24_00565 [candidate division WWE3 bacterium CG10_big_fil_rev_8_21_14_0_10_32_10]|uniref:Uncharacterized protein n=1 Tax=candidate division WWE3 bacterium CG10_big_fil_rev_8_21_14_0_10_32_10 TaxID=1975090 RepID=A0A2H0RBJ6_UNCKA|nr:MAG: hypothetical protein COV24_00565 [candidate division WWE3 bacterium CG10_big_fil_rev_8_21_14_0_10_32_10]
MFIKKLSIEMVAFFQALGVLVYIACVSVLFWQGNNLFGNVPNYMGPLLFLLLFASSALICTLLVLGYPIKLFWLENKKKEALKLLVYTSLWMVAFVLLVFSAVLFF